MNREQVWKNFDLGTELEISGAFIYNGLRSFHEMRTLDRAEEIFEFLYNLSVGMERLLKIAVVLLEHDSNQDQKEFEKSLITHTHMQLLDRIKARVGLAVATPHHELLELLGTFYNKLRYERFTLATRWNPNKEKSALRSFIEKRLDVVLEERTAFMPSLNTDRYKKCIGNLVGKICTEVYRIISDTASSLNLYTYEISSESKASKIFMKKEWTFVSEDVLWKELLVFFMNTKETCGLLRFMRGIDPLGFDVGLASDYLDCFQSERGKQAVVDELDALYSDLETSAERLDIMNAIGNPNVDFSEDDEGEEVDLIDESSSDAREFE